MKVNVVVIGRMQVGLADQMTAYSSLYCESKAIWTKQVILVLHNMCRRNKYPAAHLRKRVGPVTRRGLNVIRCLVSPDNKTDNKTSLSQEPTSGVTMSQEYGFN